MTQAFEGVRPPLPNDGILISALDWKPTSDADVLRGWNEGQGFKIWNGPACSGGDRLGMILGGFHHVMVVYSLEDQSVHYCVINLDRIELVKAH